MSQLPAKCIPWIEAALEHSGDTHTLEDIEQGVATGRLQLWIGERCALVTEFQTFPRKRAFNIFLAGGDATEFPTLEQGMQAYARAGGASVFLASCRVEGPEQRRGVWQRLSDRLSAGFNATWIVMTKEIQP